MRFPALLLLVFTSRLVFGIGQPRYVDTAASHGNFAIVRAKHAATIFADGADYPGVTRAAGDLAADIARVTDVTPALVHDGKAFGAQTILVGTIGHSGAIDRLIREGKLDVKTIASKWESFVIQVVSKPAPGAAISAERYSESTMSRSRSAFLRGTGGRTFR